MSNISLVKLRLKQGVWEGMLVDAEASGAPGEAPRVAVTCLGEAVPGVELRPDEGGWRLRVPIPAEHISEGVSTYLIQDADSGARLGSFAVIAGDDANEDLRAELDLLRAELDMLKRAFRRHCLETGG